uniref:Uncharacterized protein n=1 Tax=Populus trichocarpa TaxID=3694 RepID=B9HZR0_POPTR
MLTDVMLRAVWFGPACKAAYDADKVFLAAFDKFDAMMPKGNFYAPDVYKARKLGVLCWVMGDASGNVGRRVLQIFVMLNNIGVLVAYMIIIADVLSGTYSSGVHRVGVLEEWAYLSSSFHYLSRT